MPIPSNVIDLHAHVAVIGNGSWSEYGGLSKDYQSKLIYRIFLCLAGLQHTPLESPHITDEELFAHLVTQINSAAMPKMVALALDRYIDRETRQASVESSFWVANEFITDKLQPATGDKVLFGASVNPNRPAAEFQSQVKDCIDRGAVLLKWVPSALGVDLADDHVASAMQFLATACPGGKPLPLLLHVGPEHSFPPPKGLEWMETYNFLSWTTADDRRFRKFGTNLHRPAVTKIAANLEAALHAGAIIIFAHCGLEYYSNEHSDFSVVSDFLARTAAGEFEGKACADISSCVTPWRKPFFDDLRSLPPELLFYGSDFPTPTFDLSPDSWDEFLDTLGDIFLRGQISRLVASDGNPFDAAYTETAKFFGPDHKLFTNFSTLLSQ